MAEGGREMYWIAMVLFLGGIYLFGLAFMLPAFQGVVFVLGILCVGLAMALPMYARSTQRARGDYETYTAED